MKKKILVPLATSMIIMTNSICFASTNSIADVTYQTSDYNEDTTSTVSVTASKASTISYKIPTSISLDSSGNGSFDVSVKGDIEPTQSVSILAPSSFTITNNSDTKLNAKINISSNNIDLNSSDISDTSFNSNTMNLSLDSNSKLSSGNWTGNFTLEIKVK